MDIDFGVITFISKTFISRRTRVANFAEIIKIEIIVIKTTYKDSIKFRKNLQNCIKLLLLSAFPDIAKITNFW